MASVLDHVERSMINDEAGSTPNIDAEKDFVVEGNPFAFMPGQLIKMFSPRSLEAFYRLGGIDGIENGPQTHPTTEPAIERPMMRRRAKVTWSSTTEHSNDCQCHEQQDEELPSTAIDYHPSLAVEVEDVYSHLTKVRARCTKIQHGRCGNNEKNSDLSSEKWDALEAVNRSLLGKDHDLSIASPSISPQLQHFRKLVYDHSLQSRNLRRFSDCLLPLLRREQDLESAEQWMEMMSLSSSLVEILGKNDLVFGEEEKELLDTIDQIETILRELKLWFRRRYKSLSVTKEVTEKQSLVEVIFEYPNNIRHTCTTMPWTIRPALLILWGVCWMFIIFGGAGRPGYEELEALNPLVSPVPAVYDLDDFLDFDIPVTLSDSIVDDPNSRGYGSILDDFAFGNIEMLNDPNNALVFSQTTPRDPNFLCQDLMSRNDAQSAGILGQDSTKTSSAAGIQSSFLGEPLSTDKICASGAAGRVDVIGSDPPATSADERFTKPKPRFMCSNCSQTFVTSFTLSRHQAESHQRPEELFLCPSPRCKRSSANFPFKRHFHLKRHLDKCKHYQQSLQQQDDQTSPRSASAPTPVSHLQYAETDQAVIADERAKRPRPDDEGSDDELLLAQVKKKYRKMEEEVRKKKDEYLNALNGLEALEKAIEVLKAPPKKS
ncbi:hypothetical protein FPOAC2_00267 [Fusarium poae]|uniref:hypothetical protein n=1 Tax=Fusarium poae TaxID=36050 RepID=UPI001CEB2EB6|nr:hypothetical protein FPOAC1_000224 [Fusarium poae]KAG8674260.1 hypothetical protein FPOAC1_000224 [Fusarium poae]